MGGDDGQAAPDVLENAASEGEACLQRVVVQGQGDVAFEEQAGPVLIGHPVAEEDERVGESEFAGDATCVLQRRWACRSRMGFGCRVPGKMRRTSVSLFRNFADGADSR